MTPSPRASSAHWPSWAHSANKPLVVRLDGNNVEEGRRILAEANHPLVTLAATMDEGADKAAELANAAK